MFWRDIEAKVVCLDMVDTEILEQLSTNRNIETLRLQVDSPIEAATAVCILSNSATLKSVNISLKCSEVGVLQTICSMMGITDNAPINFDEQPTPFHPKLDGVYLGACHGYNGVINFQIWDSIELFIIVGFFAIRNVLRSAVYEKSNMNQVMDETLTRRMFYANRYKRIRDYEILMVPTLSLTKGIPHEKNVCEGIRRY